MSGNSYIYLYACVDRRISWCALARCGCAVLHTRIYICVYVDEAQGVALIVRFGLIT